MDTHSKRVSRFGVGLALLVILAAIPRLLSFSFSLPYIDHPDEPNRYLAVLEWRGLYQYHEPGYYAGYPPAYLALGYVVQTVGQPLGVDTEPEVIHVMRFISVIANLATVVFIALTARIAAGDIAGWVAGTAWGVAPLVVANGVYAIQDPLVYMMVSLALWLAAAALADEKRQHWAIWSVVAGLLATLLKYPAVAAIGPGGVVGLVYFLRDWRRNWRTLAIQIGLVAVIGVWVFVRVQAMASYSRLASAATHDTFKHLFALGVVGNNLLHALDPLMAIPFLVITGLGVAAFAVARWRKLPQANWQVVLLAVLLLIAIPWLVATFNDVQGRLRYVLPATAAACVILGAAVGQIAHLATGRWTLPASIGAPLIVAAVVFLPQARDTWALTQNRMLPDRRVEMRYWADVNLDPGLVIVTPENDKTFNPLWGGLQGKKWFDWYTTDDIMQMSIQGWRDQHQAAYAVLRPDQVQAMQASDEGRAYLAQMLHLRDFVGGAPHRGPEMAFYRLWRMDVETHIVFDNRITLLGYDVDSEQVAPGGALTLRFYWNASATPQDNYSLFVHLMPLGEETLVSQADGNPAVPERLTLTWDDPSETLISPPFVVPIPVDLPPGDYRVVVGLYNFQTGVRLPVTAPSDSTNLGDSVDLLHITVTP